MILVARANGCIASSGPRLPRLPRLRPAKLKACMIAAGPQMFKSSCAQRHPRLLQRCVFIMGPHQNIEHGVGSPNGENNRRVPGHKKLVPIPMPAGGPLLRIPKLEVGGPASGRRVRQANHGWGPQRLSRTIFVGPSLKLSGRLTA